MEYTIKGLYRDCIPFSPPTTSKSMGLIKKPEFERLERFLLGCTLPQRTWDLKEGL